MNTDQFSKLFPFGAHLCREPMPLMSEMKKDMENLKRHGFNLIKLQENWMLDEPEAGLYDFSRYYELVEYASRLDLGIYFGLTCEQAPNWLFEKYPDCRMIRRDGLPVVYQAQSTLPSDGKPGPCYDNPDALARQNQFIRKLVSELGRYENIVIWNTWQEIGYWSEQLIGSHVCYCPHTINAYQRWLSDYYNQDVELMNYQWNVRYKSFSDIYPERGIQTGDTPHEFFFRYFMDNVQIAHVLQERFSIIRKTDALKRPVFAHKGGPALSAGTDWTYARTQDFLGTSNYPAWNNGHPWDDHRQKHRPERHSAIYTEMWDGLAYRLDHIRCANQPGAPIWAAEFQGGPVSTSFHMGRVPNADDMNRWLLTSIGAGTTAISFWVARAEIMAPETNGFSLLNSEGETSERYEEAAKIGKALNQYATLFNQNNTPLADVAILQDEWKFQQLRTLKFASDVLFYSVRGWYKLFWENNITCDFIEAGYLSEEHIKQYKAIIVPMPLSMSDVVAKSLLNYAQQGGNLIFEAAPGRLNERGYAVRGEINPLIREALKISQDKFQMIREPAETDRWSQPERTWGEYAEAAGLAGEGLLSGLMINANMYIQTFKTDISDEDFCHTILKYNGEPAGLLKNYGNGSIFLFGTYIGPGATAYYDESINEVIKRIMAECNVIPSHSGKLLLRKRVSEAHEAWIVTNPCQDVLTESFNLPPETHVSDLMDKPVTASHDKVTITLNPLEVRVLIFVLNSKPE